VAPLAAVVVMEGAVAAAATEGAPAECCRNQGLAAPRAPIVASTTDAISLASVTVWIRSSASLMALNWSVVNHPADILQHIHPRQKLGQTTLMWHQELAILDSAHVLTLGSGALVLACVSFMVGVDGIAARGMRLIACAVTGMVVLASP
jgi:hypothetical protein